MFNLANIAAATPTPALTPCELVTDEMLRRYGNADASLNILSMSEDELAQLVMILPDMCQELLVRRRNSQAFDSTPFPKPRNDCEEIANARHGVDANPIERAESIAQAAADELAEVAARLSELEASVSELFARERVPC